MEIRKGSEKCGKEIQTSWTVSPAIAENRAAQ